VSLRLAIETAAGGADVPSEQLEAAFGEIMDGNASPVQCAGLLVALRTKRESVSEIVSVARALRARGTSGSCSDPLTVDTCGTGGGGIGTFNISTTAAFVVAGAGVPVAKHGNRAATSASGSFDVLEELGVRIDLPVDVCADILSQIGIGVFFARTAHPAMRHLAEVRKELGVRTLMNCMGPLLNPVGAPNQLVGVYSEDLVLPLARALGQLGAARALVVHGSDGLDELTTTGPSSAALLADGEVRSLRIDPTDYGLALVKPESLQGGDPVRNAEILRAILSGEPGPGREIVLLNAAGAIWASGAVPDLAEGLVRARASIDSGRAVLSLEALVKATGAAADEGR
jgi:anthranilate phosphoribosyltransferase